MTEKERNPDWWVSELKQRRQRPGDKKADYHLLTELFANDEIFNDELSAIRHLTMSAIPRTVDFVAIQKKHPTVDSLAKYIRPRLDIFFDNKNRIGFDEIKAAIVIAEEAMVDILVGQLSTADQEFLKNVKPSWDP